MKKPVSVELKVTAAPDQGERVLEWAQGGDAHPAIRQVVFFDTINTALFSAGVILRARQVHDGPDDSTVKCRGLDLDRLPDLGEDEGEYKVEEDRVDAQSVVSASLTLELKNTAVGEVLAGRKGISRLYSDAQERIFRAVAPKDADFESLRRTIGPIQTEVWKFREEDWDERITVERWALPGEEVIEISTRVARNGGDASWERFMDFLARRSITPQAGGDTKTMRAFDLFPSRS